MINNNHLLMGLLISAKYKSNCSNIIPFRPASSKGPLFSILFSFFPYQVNNHVLPTVALKSGWTELRS